MEETFTGELTWVDQQGQELSWSEVGPVAYSEGHRMASLIFAGREVAKTVADSGSATTQPSAPTEAGPAPKARIGVLLETAEILAAGGLVPRELPMPAEPPCDVVVARSYRHRALAEAVVRLIPELLIPGEDPAMEFFGFKPAESSDPVAFTRRRSLGFPGWALVNDPGRAAYALGVVKEFKKFANQAHVKLLVAKEGFDALGERLGRKVPHFLPSFYEEVARVFVEVGNTTYAGQYFGKAREAEFVHALAVDEQRRLASFVEFTLAGALTAKALVAYAQDLAKSFPPRVAYESFRELCLRRVRGGLPPFAGMAKALRGLIRAAGLDVTVTEGVLLREMLSSPVIGRAPGEFWSSFQPSLVTAAREDAVLRGRLLNIFPGTGLGREFQSRWLDLLRDSGALTALTALPGTVPAEAEMVGSPAVFFSRFIASFGPSWYQPEDYPEPFYRLLREAAPRLRSDGVPLGVDNGFDGRNRKIPVHLLDLALELGLPVAEPFPGTKLDLEIWHRDPVFIAADPRFSPLLEEALVDLVQGDSENKRVARDKKALLPARRAYFEKQLKALGEGSLLAAKEAATRLLKVWSPRVLEDFPELSAHLSDFDPEALLARTLRAGLMDELGWPDLEAAAAELSGTLRLTGAFPYMAVANRRRAIVVGPSGRIAEFDLKLPADADLELLRYSGGQLLVVLRVHRHGLRAFWSSDPASVFEVRPWDSPLSDRISIELDGGVIWQGGQALQPGDRQVARYVAPFGDGEQFWQSGWEQEGLQEIDPFTGKTGRFSLPKFFEEFARPGDRLNLDKSYLYPLPAGLEASPLSTRGGLAGWRIRQPEGTEGTYESEGIDGRRWQSGPEYASAAPLALLSFPGDDRPRLVRSPATLWDADGRYPLTGGKPGEASPFVAGSPFILPLPCWHYLRPRDPAGSAALRCFDDEKAARLLAAARLDLAAVARDPTATLDSLEELIPELSHPRLRKGVVGLARLTAQLAETVGELLRVLPSVDQLRGELTLDQRNLMPALFRLLERSYFLGIGSFEDVRQMVETHRFLAEVEAGARDPRRVAVSSAHWPWELLLARPGGLAFLAANRGTSAEEREVYLRLLDFLSLLPSEGGRLRCYSYRSPIPPPGAAKQFLAVEFGNAYLVKFFRGLGGDAIGRVLEFAPEGTFRQLEGAGLDFEVRISWPSAAVRRFAETFATRGIPAWDAKIGAEIARRTGFTPAAAALLWLGCPGFDYRQNNFLPKDLRVELGFKVTEAAEARKEVEAFLQVEHGVPPWIAELYEAAFAVGVDALWQPLGLGPGDESSAVAAFANALIRRTRL